MENRQNETRKWDKGDEGTKVWVFLATRALHSRVELRREHGLRDRGWGIQGPGHLEGLHRSSLGYRAIGIDGSGAGRALVQWGGARLSRFKIGGPVGFKSVGLAVGGPGGVCTVCISVSFTFCQPRCGQRS